VKYAGNFKKQMLIDAFKDALPEPVWNRPKMGFSFPFKEWLAKDELVRTIINSGGDKVKKGYQNFLNV
jgi:asparagine synthase (glutamine-hydrolysing)